MFDLTIQVDTVATHVAVQPGLLQRLGALLRAARKERSPAQVVVVSDRRVAKLFMDDARTALEHEGWTPLEHVIEPGEASKSLDVAGRLFDHLARARVRREAVILALGGGVVSDLAGFVAATWMRGIDFAICPTTVEAAVDASIGGKTAVNIAAGKNLVGVFHQPILVATDPLCLSTLDPRDVRAGLAESVKHALITSEDFLEWHEHHAAALTSLDPASMTELILRNVRIKADVVERDPRERTDVRIMLNFGHTLGHAIETCCDYSLRHGECVALGMLAACRLSSALGMLEGRVAQRLEHLLATLGLPTTLTTPIDTDRIMAATRSDKKARGRTERYVLLSAIGQPVVRENVPDDAIRAAYESLL